MNDTENRRRQMFARVLLFFSARVNDFAATSVARQLVTALAAIVTELDGYAASEVSGVSGARVGTSTRNAARAALREALEAISRTAQAMAGPDFNLEEKFRVPKVGNDQRLLSAARASASDAVPFSAQFIAHELPADFLEDLNVHIAALEAAMNDQSTGVGHHVAAAVAIDDAINRGVEVVRKLDAIVKNKYANNASVLAEWTSASHTERAPRRGQTSEPPPSPAPAAGAGSSSPSA